MSADEAQTGGPGVMVSYRELVAIRTQMTSMDGKLTAALALSGRVDTLDVRVGHIERWRAGLMGEKKTWNTVRAFFGGAVTLAACGGAINILPKLWVWLHALP